MRDEGNALMTKSGEENISLVCPLPSKDEVLYVWTSDKVQVMLYWWNGNLLAHSAMCPHMGSQLTLNREAGEIKCPWHALRADPAELVFNHPRYRSVRKYRTMIKDDKVYLAELLPRKESAL
jgi:nitrite reductase/ring-hydroxylating ferredoxin subunit